ncbi:MAG: rolling circle replication-associated protein [Patescibacteria group bacterium]|jgi:hypothetical protein
MNKEFKYFSNKKVVKSGPLLEIYQFGRDINLGQKIRHIKNDEEKDAQEAKSKSSQEEIIKSSARRAKRLIKRIIMSNCFLWFKENGQPYLPITLTLTFANNITDLKQANYEFTKFIRRLNYETNAIEGKDLKQSNLKYLAVFELQKRGAIHYHMIFFNLLYIKDVYQKMYKIWGRGRIMVGGKNKNFKKVRDQEQLNKIIFYFIKYIQKSVFENYYPGKRTKKYITSKGLLKPLENSASEVVSLVESKLPNDSLVYKYDGETEYNQMDIKDTIGKTNNFLRWLNYSQYDLSNNPELGKEISQFITGFNIDDIDF